MKVRLHILLLQCLFLLMLGAGVVMLLGAVRTKDAKPCSGVQINYGSKGQRGFMKQQDVMDMIRNYLGADPLTVNLHQFNLNALEAALEENVWVRDAQLYFDNKQVLNIEIEERIPVARMIDKAGQSFYVDELGLELALSTTHRADVPVFTGVPLKRNTVAVAKKIWQLIDLAVVIGNDSFWLAQIAQIDVQTNGQLELYPTLGHHVVEFGDATNPEGKLNRLKVFYHAMANHRGLDAFPRINVAYEGQVVVHKSETSVTKEDKIKAMSTYKNIVSENKQEVDAGSIVSEIGVGRIVEAAPPVAEPKAAPKATLKPEAETPKVEVPAPPKEVPEDKKPKAVMPKLENN